MSLQSVHTLPQKAVSGSGRYQCLWGGCKVHGQAATSFTWLQTHVTKHVGTKPFLCIVAGCRMRFGSQVRSENNSIFHRRKYYLFFPCILSPLCVLH